ncbi:MAG: transposase, partial [Deltaproteobacteria bacterium]|nr:transposase [Deltaproteobacteria bacterium]
MRACQRQAALAAATSLQRQDTDHEDRYAPLYCAAIDGFSLHANVTLRAGDPDALRRVIRYGARQAFAQDRLSLTDDGRVAYRL